MSTDRHNATSEATFAVKHAAVTDIGLRRANNQDAVAVVLGDRQQWLRRGHFFMVADGMGAHAAGELASKLAADNVSHTYQKLPTLAAPDALHQAVLKANEAIHRKGQSASEFNGMGTTCSCLALLPEGAIVAHVGDSRVYRLRNQQLEQLTFDHSLVWELAAVSQTSAEEVPACIPKNVITRSLGPGPKVEVDLEGPFGICPGDKFLLCSDGLTGVVDDPLIGSLLNCLPPQEAADTLVDVANLRGGPDNISIIIVEVPDSSDSGASDCGKSNGANSSFPRPCWWRRLFQFFRRDYPRCTEPSEMGGPFGKGPYRNCHCEPSTAASDISFLCRELNSLENSPEASLVEHAAIDWEAFHQQCDKAASVKKKEPQKAIALFARAIRQLMAQVRNGTDQGKQSDGSNASRVF